MVVGTLGKLVASRLALYRFRSNSNLTFHVLELYLFMRII